MNRKKLVVPIALLLCLVSLAYIPSVEGDGEEWLDGWTYRKSHTINNATGAGTNYQIPITVYTGSGSDSGGDVYLDGRCQADFDDVRFTDNDGETLLDCWLETSDSESGLFWVEVGDDLGSDVTIYLYYGNLSVSSVSHGANTWILYDHFDDGSLGADWTITTGSPSESGTLLDCTGDDVRSTSSYGNMQFRFSATTDGSGTGWQLGTRKLDDSEYIIFWRSGSPNVYRQRIYDGSYTENVETEPDREVYHTWHINYDQSTRVEFYVNDTLRYGYGLNIPDDDHYTRFISYSGNPLVSIDWAAIGKYVYPAPSSGAWGSEESVEYTFNEGLIFGMVFAACTGVVLYYCLDRRFS